jgi:nitrogenase subunit NifH
MRIFSSLAVATIVIAPQRSSLIRPPPSACVAKTVLDLFARNGALKQRDVKTVVTDAKRGVKEKVANTGEKKGARCRRRGVNEDPVLS